MGWAVVSAFEEASRAIENKKNKNQQKNQHKKDET